MIIPGESDFSIYLNAIKTEELEVVDYWVVPTWTIG